MAPTRKIFESEAQALVHDHYVVTLLETTCSCGEHYSHSELYEVWTHPTKTATTGMKQLRSTNTLQGGFAIHRVKLAPRTVPVCVVCEGNRVKPDAWFPALSYDEWARTVKRKAQERNEVAARPSSAAQRPEPKLEDL